MFFKVADAYAATYELILSSWLRGLLAAPTLRHSSVCIVFYERARDYRYTIP